MQWAARLGCAGVVLLLVLFVGQPMFNNWKFGHMAESFRAMRHPGATSRVKYVQQFGNLSGTSNHCDYFAGELRTYTGSKQSIRAFYKGVKVWDPVSFSLQPVEVAWMEDDLIDTEHSGRSTKMT